jgi:hypothetical protein
MPGVIVATDLEDEWHPLYNPFKTTILVEEYVYLPFPSDLLVLPAARTNMLLPHY